MYFIGYFFITIANIMYSVLHLFMIIIIARVVLSWVNPNPYHPIAQTLIRIIYALTDPPLNKLRTKFPLSYGGMDFSPLILIFSIFLLTGWLVPSLEHLGRSLVAH